MSQLTKIAGEGWQKLFALHFENLKYYVKSIVNKNVENFLCFIGELCI